MVQICLEIPEKHAQRVIVALCKAGGLTPSRENAQAVLMQSIKQNVFNVERQEAERAALERVPDPKVDDLFDVDPNGETPGNKQ